MRRRKGSGDLPGLQSRRSGSSRAVWWVRLPHASANISCARPGNQPTGCKHPASIEPRFVNPLREDAGTMGNYFQGVLGQDVLRPFSSCTLDSRNMRYICARNSSASRKSSTDKDGEDD